MQFLEKHCSKCGELKPLTSFSKDNQSSSGYKSHCKACRRLDYSRLRAANLEHHRKKDRLKHYKKKYNLPDELVNKLVEDRSGVCSICGNISQLVVDHCHSSGNVRGLICSHCNCMLGYSRDNIQTLKSAIKYLEDFYA